MTIDEVIKSIENDIELSVVLINNIREEIYVNSEPDVLLDNAIDIMLIERELSAYRNCLRRLKQIDNQTTDISV